LLYITCVFGAPRFLAQSNFQSDRCVSETALSTTFQLLDTCIKNNGAGYNIIKYNGTHVLITAFASGDSQCLKPFDTYVTHVGTLPTCLKVDDYEFPLAIKYEIMSKPTPLVHKVALMSDFFTSLNCTNLVSSYYYYVPSCSLQKNKSFPSTAIDCDKNKGFSYDCKDDVCHNCEVTDTLELNVCLPAGDGLTLRAICQPPPPVSASESPKVELKYHKIPQKLRKMPIQQEKHPISAVFFKEN